MGAPRQRLQLPSSSSSLSRLSLKTPTACTAFCPVQLRKLELLLQALAARPEMQQQLLLQMLTQLLQLLSMPRTLVQPVQEVVLQQVQRQVQQLQLEHLLGTSTLTMQCLSSSGWLT